MKASKNARYNVGCMYFVICFVLMVMQVMFLTLKCTGVVDWSWWAVLIPTIIVFGLPFAVVIVVVIALIPSAVWKAWKTSKRVNAMAAKYGMKRQPGESTSDLKKRIIRRNMISGNYSRKDIKDMILDNFPAVGGCFVSVNDYTKTITLVLHRAYTDELGSGFTDAQLAEVATFAAQYIHVGYTVTAKNA